MQELLPKAVREVGDFTDENGEKVDKFLMVNKVTANKLFSLKNLESN